MGTAGPPISSSISSRGTFNYFRPDVDPVIIFFQSRLSSKQETPASCLANPTTREHPPNKDSSLGSLPRSTPPHCSPTSGATATRMTSSVREGCRRACMEDISQSTRQRWSTGWLLRSVVRPWACRNDEFGCDLYYSCAFLAIWRANKLYHQAVTFSGGWRKAIWGKMARRVISPIVASCHSPDVPECPTFQAVLVRQVQGSSDMS